MPTVEPGIYRHYKGALYQVLGAGAHTETGEAFVVYHPVHEPFRLHLRPLQMFLEPVLLQDGLEPRFVFVP
jgi:hypothetical protein